MRPRSTVIFIAMMLIGLALPIIYTKLEMSEKRAQRLLKQQQEAPRVVEIPAPPPTATPSTIPTPASPPVTAVVTAVEVTAIAPEHAVYLDRMAGVDIADAIKAWNDLALLYTSEKELVRDYGAALQDTRPIPFTLSEESWTDTDGKVSRYCAAHDVAPAGSQQTVGYALRCHQTRLKETGQ